MTDTNTPAKDTSEEDGKNTEGKNEGEDTPPKPEDAPKFTQADQNALAAKVRKEEKEKFDKKLAEDKRLADEAKAKEQGEFQQLAEAKAREIEELKPKLEAVEKELADKTALLSSIVKEQLKALPEEVREAAPAQYAEDKSLTNPDDVLAWLPKGKALAEKLTGQSAVKGNGPSPRANGGRGDPKADERARAQARQAYRD